MHSLHAKKSLGQHFLTDPGILSRIALLTPASPGDLVIEIGPGKGAITAFLLEQGFRVLALEKDDRMIEHLQERFSSFITSGFLTLIHEDALSYNYSQHDSFHIVGNIPYYITGILLRTLLESSSQPESITFVIQKEVAKRIVEHDGKTSILSLSVRVFGEPSLAFSLSRKVFRPQPRVDSAVLCIRSISRSTLPSDMHYRTFFTLVRAGFAHKRKQLVTNLSSIIPKDLLLTFFDSHSLSHSVRAEDLSFELWRLLTLFICEHVEVE